MQDFFDKKHPDLPLRFGGLLVIVGGGVVDIALLQQLHNQGAAVVAADSGADECAKAGIVPDAIIGDLDSLNNPDDWAQKTRVIKIAEQITTDFEKCLYTTKAPVTVVLGMTGKRLDHTLAALSAMTAYAQKRHVILMDDEDMALAVAGAFSFEVEAGDRVSMHPLVPISFARTEGLEYPLDGLTLAPGVLTGTSNRALEGRFTATPIKDDVHTPWLLMIEKKYLGALIGELERLGVAAKA